MTAPLARDDRVTELRDQIDIEPPRELPCNTAVEQALLAAMLVDNSALAKVDFLRPDDFAWSVHGPMFEAMVKLATAGQPANALTIAGFFRHDPSVWRAYAGGDQYVFRVAESVVTVANAADYGLIVSDLALRRALIDTLMEPAPAQTTLDVLVEFQPRIVALAKVARWINPNER
jgi:replicative DNA helicase